MPEISKTEQFAKAWKEIDGHLLVEPRDRRAYMVVIASLIVGPHPRKIASLTGLSYFYVHEAAKKLYDNGIWVAGGKIALESDQEDADHLYVEITLHAMCITGMVVTNHEDKWRDGICMDCGAERSYGSGKRCRVCYRARSRLLNS